MGNLADKCQAIKKLGDPTFSLGFAMSAEATSGYSFDAGVEFGLAMSRSGKKMCYIGHCTAVGVTFPPAVSTGTDQGLVASIWGNPSNIPGKSQTIAFDIGINIPFGAASVGVEGGIEYIFAKPGSPLNFLGLAISGEAEVDGGIEFPGIGVSSAQCDTPICLTTEGKEC